MKKGFTYEEALGEKKAREVKKKLSKGRIISKEKIVKEFKKTWKKFGPMTKVESRKYFICNEETIRYKFNGLDNFAKECNIKFKKGIGGHIKGITWEEIHGDEKAQKLRQNRKEKMIGKSWIERFGLEKAQQMKKSVAEKQSKKYKGKSYEERFGLEKALEMREEQRKKRKGKTLEELYGKEKAKIIRNKIRINRVQWTKENIIQSIKKLFEEEGNLTKTEVCCLSKEKKLCGYGTIRKHFNSLDDLAKHAEINFKHLKGRLGTNETKLLDDIEVIHNVKISRTVSVRANNKQYFIDGYDPINKVAYEIDEPYHKNQQVEDFIREREIKEKLGCEFIRIKDDVWNIKASMSQKSLDNFTGEIK